MFMPAAKISISNGQLQVPSHPIIPFIIGDGIGPDIWNASVRVFDAAVKKAAGDPDPEVAREAGVTLVKLQSK